MHPHSRVASSKTLVDFVNNSCVAAKQKARKRIDSSGGTKLCIVARIALKPKLSHALSA